MELTEREKEIIPLIKDVPNLNVLAKKLGVSYSTLQWHLGRLYAKFHVRCRLQLVIKLMTDANEVGFVK